MSRRKLIGMVAGVAGAAILAACGGSATATPVTSTATTAAGAAATQGPTTTSATAAASSTATRPAATTGPTAAPAATVAATTVASAPASGASTPAATVQKVNANTATQAEVAQVLQVNGVPNAARWAVEVVEYRPYPTNDPTFAKLRTNLAKYNPEPAVVEQIVASLSL